MKVLSRKGLVRGVTLDYGCGRGFDADTLNMVGYDPYWRDDKSVLIPSHYDTITCLYVLNVVECPQERTSVLRLIRELLKPTGRAYVSVRTDKSALQGRTKSGSWQGYIELDEAILYESNRFRIYTFLKRG